MTNNELLTKYHNHINVLEKFIREQLEVKKIAEQKIGKAVKLQEDCQKIISKINLKKIGVK